MALEAFREYLLTKAISKKTGRLFGPAAAGDYWTRANRVSEMLSVDLEAMSPEDLTKLADGLRSQAALQAHYSSYAIGDLGVAIRRFADYRALIGAVLSYAVPEDMEFSVKGFADWRAALGTEAKTLRGAISILPKQKLVLSTKLDRKSGAMEVSLASGLPAPPWSIEINEPTKPGGENRTAAIALSSDGRRVLLRQGRLQKNDLSDSLIVGELFRVLTGLSPVKVTLANGDAVRDWYLVADLDAEPVEICDQTAVFVDACSRARRLFGGAMPDAATADLLAKPEVGGTYLTAGSAAKPPAEVRRVQGDVWQALVRLCDKRKIKMQKPLHASGYEADVELCLANEDILIEIKTGRKAADVYGGVGQLMLYPKLIPRLSSHRRILLLRGDPTLALRGAVAACGIDVHNYRLKGAGPTGVAFSTEFLTACGLQ